MTSEQLALVTGANRGLGREVARQLLGEGYTVLLGARDPGAGAAVARELAEDGKRVSPIRLDVTDPADAERAADRIRHDHGRLDVLINNAGVTTGALPFDTASDDLRRVFEVNTFSVVTMVRTMLPLLRRSVAPRVVNVSSHTASLTLTAEGEPIPGDADRRLAYSASKAALNMLTVQYARAFRRAPDLSHVKINCAVPGFTATDMNRHRGTRSVTDGARIIVALARLPDDGPSGGVFDDHGPVAW